MNKRLSLNRIRTQRSVRTRTKLRALSERPRLSVFRSNTSFYAQLIDDATGKTIVSVSVKDLSKTNAKNTKSINSAMLGEMMAEKAKKAGITKVVFDRGDYAYHGRVKAFAEGARKGGMEF